MKSDSMFQEVPVEEAVGMVLAHDLTQILPGQMKHRLFKKGHRILETDIPKLLNIGKEHIYALELKPGFIHEDEAAMRMAEAIRGANMELTDPYEGKVTLNSTIHGLLKIRKSFIDQVNAMDQVIMSTLLTNTVVMPKQALLGTRIIPLLIEESIVARIEQFAHQSKLAEAASTVEVKPFKQLKVGLITTGSEVFKKRIPDKFGPIVKEKVAALGSEVIEQRFTPDETETIIEEIYTFLGQGVDAILVTGGMSVDPDDRTPGAIRQTGADIVSYGTPMLPGSMLMVAYLGETPILGLPGCVMHDPYTSFDALWPRICAGERIMCKDIIELGYGGLRGC